MLCGQYFYSNFWLQSNSLRKHGNYFTICLCIEYCCHIWSCASATYLEILDKIQRVCNVIGPDTASWLQSFSHLPASLCIFYKFVHGNCDELPSLVPFHKFKLSTRLTVRSHHFSVNFLYLPSFLLAFFLISCHLLSPWILFFYSLLVSSTLSNSLHPSGFYHLAWGEMIKRKKKIKIMKYSLLSVHTSLSS